MSKFKDERNYEFCTRGARHILKKQDPNIKFLDEYSTEFVKAFASISKFLFQNMIMKVTKNGKKYKYELKLFGYDVPSFQKKNILFQCGTKICKDKDGNIIKDENGNIVEKPIFKRLHDYITSEVTKQNILKNNKIQTTIRNIVLAVLSNYDAQFKRFKRQGKTINRPLYIDQNKGIRFDETIIKYNKEKTKISFPGFECRKRIDIEYYLPGTIKKCKPFLNKKQFGGTLKNEKGTWRLTLAYQKPIKYIYDPVKWYGMDINATNDYWIILASNPLDYLQIFKQQNIIDIENQIHNYTSQINDRKNVHGRKRRYLNNKRWKTHSQYLKLIDITINMVLDYVKKHKAGLIIDNVRPGSNTFGQDKIVPELIKRCEDNGIPFYIGNPAYTSRDCINCNNRNSKRGDTNNFKCEKCGFEMNSHLKSALSSVIAAKKQTNFLW